MEDQRYREFFDAPNPVKGEALLGLSTVPSSADAQLSNTVSVLFSEHYEGPLTVETLTADGAFRGIGTFFGATDEIGWNSLPIVPESAGAPAQPRPADPQALAVAVRGLASNEFRVAHWGKPPAADEDLTLRFYVNSQRGDMSLRAGRRVVPCTKVQLSRPLRFDVYCDLALSELPPENAVDLIRRDRFRIEAQRIVVLR
jgi:hypothetical protein